MKRLIPFFALLTSALCNASEQPLKSTLSPHYNTDDSLNPGLALYHMSDTHANRNRNEQHIAMLCAILNQTGNIHELTGSNSASELATRDSVIAMSGDLIDGQSGLDHHKKWFWLLHCLPWFQKGRNQTETFEKVYLDPLEQTGAPILLCDGNHDQADPTESLLELIKNKHGRLHHTTQQGNLHIITCGKYPDEATCSWLAKRLQELDGAPCALMLHYNLEGPYSDSWSAQEKKHFYKTIHNHNVQLILHGHYHSTHMYDWNGIPAANSGGEILPVHLFDNNGTYEKSIGLKGTSYTDAAGNEQLQINEVTLTHK